MNLAPPPGKNALVVSRMNFNLSQPESVEDSARLQMPAEPKVEIDLYDDLESFSKLPPKDRVKAAFDSHAIDLRGEPTRPTVHDSNSQNSAVVDQTAEALIPQASSVLDQPPPVVSFATAPEAVESPASPTSAESGKPPVKPEGEFQFTGAISPGVCVGCGAESGSDDLFCAGCAEFVDETEASPASPAKCIECGLPIASDEVICPNCGVVLGS